ncbi:MAG: cytochrome c-type biogenesis protein CcmH [Acidobacteriota bacterium]|nr:cytochrome c-type biogenesis protein CcmH [Acidobacteriota bacterium]
MNARRLIVAATLVLALGAGTATRAAAAQSYYSVVTQFMCVECHEALNQVNSPEAISEKQTLRGLIARNLTLGQIKAAMVAQYGQQVLAQPPASGFNLTVYVLPPAIFLGGLGLLAFTLPKWRRRAGGAGAVRPPAAAPLEPDDAKRLEDELGGFI